MKFDRKELQTPIAFTPFEVTITIESHEEQQMIHDMHDALFRIPNAVYLYRYSCQNHDWSGEIGFKCFELVAFINKLNDYVVKYVNKTG